MTEQTAPPLALPAPEPRFYIISTFALDLSTPTIADLTTLLNSIPAEHVVARVHEVRQGEVYGWAVHVDRRPPVAAPAEPASGKIAPALKVAQQNLDAALHAWRQGCQSDTERTAMIQEGWAMVYNMRRGWHAFGEDEANRAAFGIVKVEAERGMRLHQRALALHLAQALVNILSGRIEQ
jgi:hypothetical protein